MPCAYAPDALSRVLAVDNLLWHGPGGLSAVVAHDEVEPQAVLGQELHDHVFAPGELPGYLLAEARQVAGVVKFGGIDKAGPQDPQAPKPGQTFAVGHPGLAVGKDLDVPRKGSYEFSKCPDFPILLVYVSLSCQIDNSSSV